ncbi:MAG: selenocysteine-specific translation elongation factor [SAR324 cluster bacterium]|nr:selenocysteine-specific translation elongation factor [SAR324 cluster bacterium]
MPIVVGTSGHIDHGKTTLVKALTGVDADRWAEEKARGITIDIGFARYRDESGTDIAFIDVPGHERFVHNMLAGAAGLDAVMLVVAADEGVMPQTVEHLQICHLLGIKRGLVALTRCDLADDELIELSTEDVRDAVKDTFLEGAPIFPVSGVTGEGLEALRAGLAKLPHTMEDRDLGAPFRFPVDRSFTMKGFGTVVTGTVIAGTLGKNDPVIQYPHQSELRIRGFQVHGQSTDRIEAGQRAAINLAGIEKSDIERGHQLAAPGSLLNGFLINIELRLLDGIPRDLTQRTRVRLHLGTSEIIGRLVLLERETFAPGETQLVQLRLEAPVSARYGDRFIIRNYSPMFTLGGGRIIDPAPIKSRRVKAALSTRLKALAGADALALTEGVIFLQSTRGIKESEGFIRTGLGGKSLRQAMQKLASQGTIFNIDPAEKRYIHRDTLHRIGTFLLRVLNQFHTSFPERDGMTRAELAGKLSAIYSDKQVGHLLQRLVQQGVIGQQEQNYRAPGHEKSVTGEQVELMERLAARILEGGAQPMRKTMLLESCGIDNKTGMQLLNLASHDGRLVRVKDDLYYVPETLEGIERALRKFLGENEKITVVDFKDLTGVTRKHAVDLLEHFDTRKVTIRVDNERVLRQTLA